MTQTPIKLPPPKGQRVKAFDPFPFVKEAKIDKTNWLVRWWQRITRRRVVCTSWDKGEDYSTKVTMEYDNVSNTYTVLKVEQLDNKT